jgi:uncharacterized membrane protein YfcA
MLGMGGSQLYIPILYWLGMDFKNQAIPLGLLLNVCTSSSATFTYLTKGLVKLKMAFPFAVTMLVFAPGGALLNFRLPVKPIIFIFAMFTLTAAILVRSEWKPKTKIFTKKNEILLGVTTGIILGLLVGLIGRGGGSFIMPILLLIGLDPKNAAATSSFIVIFSGGAGFLTHLFKADLSLWVTLATVCSVLLGSQLGSRLMASKLKSRAIKKIFGIVLVLVAFLLLKDVFLR